ncbi:hypothetical protein [Nocardia sp. NPDC127526]|uniref:hypothetical protein n=1 Tax=Nocardia sp. NPDC127526 TaxID=3345393 RepID=UPI00362DECE1
MAWSGFVFGSVTSIAANVLHAWLPAADMPPGWTPGIAPQIGAAIWPIGLLLSVEVLSRAHWRRGRMWRLARYGGAGTVALGSAIISYGHVRDVLLAWGYGPLGASVGPLTLDGLMVISGFALLSMTTDPATSHNVTELERCSGLVSTPNPNAAIAIPPIGQDEHRMAVTEQATTPVTALSGQATATMPKPEDSEDIGADIRRTTARELHAQGWSQGRIAAELEVSKRTVRRYLSALPDSEHSAAATVSEPSTPDHPDAASAVPEEINTNHHRPLEGVPT